MNILETLIAAILGEFFKQLLPFVAQEAAAPTIASEAESDPTIQTRAADALAAFDRDHP